MKNRLSHLPDSAFPAIPAASNASLLFARIAFLPTNNLFNDLTTTISAIEMSRNATICLRTNIQFTEKNP